MHCTHMHTYAHAHTLLHTTLGPGASYEIAYAHTMVCAGLTFDVWGFNDKLADFTGDLVAKMVRVRERLIPEAVAVGVLRYAALRREASR